MTRIAVPALIVLVAVASYTGLAGWNNSGDPLLVLTVTERELPLRHVVTQSDEDPTMQLQVRYEARFDPLDTRNWLSDQRLREIGFALHVPAGSPQALDAYDHVPSRLGWVVLEYAGPQWQDIERRRALTRGETEPHRGAPFNSRLVPVDAGADFDALRQRYPTGHLIVRAVIGLSYVPINGGGRVLYGTLRQIVPDHVAVPHQFRPMLDALRTAHYTGEPRYEVDVAVGRLGLLYVRALRRLGVN